MLRGPPRQPPHFSAPNRALSPLSERCIVGSLKRLPRAKPVSQAERILECLARTGVGHYIQHMTVSPASA